MIEVERNIRTVKVRSSRETLVGINHLVGLVWASVVLSKIFLGKRETWIKIFGFML
jgi:hypothetical protein